MGVFAHAEREALADTLLRVGPDSPTLCDGWNAADLAAHLVIRESNPAAAAGIMIKPLAGFTAKAQRAARDRESYEKLVQRVRQGPPVWAPTRISALDEAANTIEFFVHHEDLRRGAGDGPRDLDPDLADALWHRLRRVARLVFRSAPVGVTLVRAEVGNLPRQTVVAKAANPAMVTLSGPVGELLLFANGRKEAAQVELTGDEPSVAKLRATKLGV
jgi:uncharacterized protein (TIGR03085 family)